ncbi:ABC transporter ATP-binding protein [Erysipelothrix sp. HDW6A]|uniref:ABC transporter ATP-binding protein n=1 Tax=Erysipelothrix sp. HDW6A TaxID=2714928 RepID=UPI00140997C4|nr:ABC transporter ATP-binding protein [Erysipelothrix sp. HDW6A]QIK58103.1 ABC transporter ATP-binding protein [Erysipelothrix sp. HDW6A]
METNVISLQSLTKKYNKFTAVQNVSLNVRKGDIYGLIGKNGAGKTTLFKMILGLSNPSEGKVSINGSSTQSELLKERNNIGFLIGSNFFGYLDAYQNIEYYRILKGIKDKNETIRVLEIVGLAGTKKPFKEYSMGMKQRLGIANAILGNPEIVILDEPVNGLDPQGIVDIRNLIKLLNEEYKMTLVVSSHILSELDLVANRFGIIDHGVLIKEVDKEHLQDSEKDSVIISTNNNARAMELILANFKLDEIKELNGKLELINGSIDTAEIVDVLVKNDLKVKEIYKVKKSLEDVYFHLTGGANSNA